MFICGSRSLGHQDKNGSHKSSSKRSKSVSNTKKKKNPYAEGGLDKFLALLADLDEKKQRIYDEIGSEDISFIRFVYSNDSDQPRPIIVRTNNSKKKLLNVKAEKNVEEKTERDVKVKAQEELLQVRRNGVNYYLILVMLVFILVFIAIYGRCFAIVCTSIAWYLVPQFIVRSSSKRKVS